MNFSIFKVLPFFLFNSFILLAQEISFMSPDTVCVNEIFNITNTSLAVDEIYWNFCSTDLSNPIEQQSLENLTTLDVPVFMDIAKDGDDYFAFITNHAGSLVRLSFGNSLENTPTETNLGNILILANEGIQIINDGQQWWGFSIGGSSTLSTGEAFTRLDFGNSLNNTPTINNFGNIGDLFYPHDLYIFKENENWFGWTINKYSFTLTRISFGNNLANEPIAENIGNIGNLYHPTGFHPQFYDDEWFLFVANEGIGNINGSITRLEFGDKLSNIPSGTNFGNLGILQKPRDIVITELCGQFVAILADHGDDNLYVLDFGTSLTNVPFPVTWGSISDLDFPHSFSDFFRIENDLILFIPNAGNSSISKITLRGCTDANPSFSNSSQPPPLSYSESGLYVIQMISNLGKPTQQSFCKEIVVLPKPELNLGNDTTICQQSSYIIESEFNNTLWQNNISGSSFEATQSDIYVAEVAYENCISYDTIDIQFSDCKNCILFPNVFTPDNNQVNDIFQPVIQCDNEPQNYTLKIFNRWGETIFSTTQIEQGWDGFHNNKIAQSDVYIWMMSYEYFDGEKMISKKEQGDVSLIR